MRRLPLLSGAWQPGCLASIMGRPAPDARQCLTTRPESVALHRTLSMPAHQLLLHDVMSDDVTHHGAAWGCRTRSLVKKEWLPNQRIDLMSIH
jgi:hypothetical protein